MSVWNKLGKILLTAAPYIAAPFTGGLSLATTGLANKAVQKWSQHDAEKNAAKGLAPSKFDSVLGKVGGIAGLGTSFIPTNALGSIGMLGNLGSAGKSVANVAGQIGKTGGFANTLGGIAKGAVGAGSGWSGALGQTLGNVGMNALSRPSSGSGNYTNPANYQQSGLGPSQPNSVMPQGGYGYNENPMNQTNQTNPNLAQSIFQGRQEALNNRTQYNPSIMAAYAENQKRKLQMQPAY